MDLILDVETGAVEEQPEKKKFLKYNSDMERLLLVTILATSAHKSGTKGTNEMKFTKVVDLLWMDNMYNSRGPKRDWSTIRHKFLTMLHVFKKKIGLGTDALVNCSALPDVDSLSETDSILFEICRDEETANAETAVLKEEADEKAAIKNGCTDVISSGGGRKGLAPMAKALLESKPTSKKYQKFSNGFGNPTGSSSTSTTSSSSSTLPPRTDKKKKRDADNVDGTDMSRLFDSILEDAKKEEERDTALLNLIEQNNKANRDALLVLSESSAAANRLLAESLATIADAVNRKK